jgi:hypothetical protein
MKTKDTEDEIEEDDTDYEFEHPSIADYNGFINFGEMLY